MMVLVASYKNVRPVLLQEQRRTIAWQRFRIVTLLMAIAALFLPFNVSAISSQVLSSGSPAVYASVRDYYMIGVPSSWNARGGLPYHERGVDTTVVAFFNQSVRTYSNLNTVDHLRIAVLPVCPDMSSLQPGAFPTLNIGTLPFRGFEGKEGAAGSTQEFTVYMGELPVGRCMVITMNMFFSNPGACEDVQACERTLQQRQAAFRDVTGWMISSMRFSPPEEGEHPGVSAGLRPLNEIYFTDGKTVYYLTKENVSGKNRFRRLTGSDVRSFMIYYDALHSPADIYAKDHRRAYYCDKVIRGVDVPTFRSIGFGYARDKRNTYRRGLRIKPSDLPTEEYVN